MGLLKAFTKEARELPTTCTQGVAQGGIGSPCSRGTAMNEAATTLTKAMHELPNTTAKQAAHSLGTRHEPVNIKAISKKRLALQLYSFMSDIDCVEEQHGDDCCELQDDSETWYKNGKLLDTSNYSDGNYSTAHCLLSTQFTENDESYHSASPSVRAAIIMPTAQEQPQYRHSRMLHGNNTQAAAYSLAEGQAGIVRIASSALSTFEDVKVEDVQLKEPKASNILAISTVLPHAMTRSAWRVKDYVLSKQLSYDSARQAVLAVCKTTGLQVVLKVYKLDRMSNIQRCQLLRDVTARAKLQHQNIVQFYCAFMEERCVVIVEEFATGGNLSSYVYRMGGRLTEKAAVHLVLKPFLRALQYLQTEGIDYGDIKHGRCLLTKDMVLKIDIGTAFNHKEEVQKDPGVLHWPMNHHIAHQFKGMPHGDAMAAETQAVGAFAYELLCGMPPVTGSKMMETVTNNTKGAVYFPKEISRGAVDFISRCFQPDPANPLTVSKLLNHPWIRMFELTSWQHACLVTRAHPYWTTTSDGCKGVNGETPQTVSSRHAQASAAKPRRHAS